ncbi:hypothetical protein RR48_03501 [Papilio machaon]|uniref:Uncharacterized protein n=1 Tax=Papilio machaon TaxID=76193 RepID=A0A0N1INL4_PAPMA|nr:hypothetical protein RR48_03501 [Papilio machaon]
MERYTNITTAYQLERNMKDSPRVPGSPQRRPTAPSAEGVVAEAGPAASPRGGQSADGAVVVCYCVPTAPSQAEKVEHRWVLVSIPGAPIGAGGASHNRPPPRRAGELASRRYSAVGHPNPLVVGAATYNPIALGKFRRDYRRPRHVLDFQDDAITIAQAKLKHHKQITRRSRCRLRQLFSRYGLIAGRFSPINSRSVAGVSSATSSPSANAFRSGSNVNCINNNNQIIATDQAEVRPSRAPLNRNAKRVMSDSPSRGPLSGALAPSHSMERPPK